MFICLFYGGKGIRDGKKSLVIIGILAFTLNEGLRFGRWIDYNYYYFSFHEALLNGQTRFNESAFVYLCRFINGIGGNFQWLIIFMSFMHIFSAVFFLRHFKEVAVFALPLYIFFSYFSAENMVRWMLGFSFILIGLYYLLSNINDKKKYCLFIFFSFLAYNIHHGLLMVIPFFVIMYFIKKAIHPVVSISLYFMFLLFFQLDFMLDFVDIANTFSSLTGSFESYADNAEKWLTTTALGLESKSGFSGLSNTIFYLFCVIIGYKLIPYFDRKYLYSYNLFVFGFILNPIANRIELLYRIDILFFVFITIVLSYIIQYTIKERKLIKIKYLPLISLLVLLNYARVVIPGTFNRTTDQMLYVWDKKGRQYLDNYTVYFLDMYKNAQRN